VKESKVSGEVDVEVDIDGKEKRGIHFPKIGGKKKGSKSKSSSLSSKDPKEHKELQKSLLAEKLACLQKKKRRRNTYSLACKKSLQEFAAEACRKKSLLTCKKSLLVCRKRLFNFVIY